MNPKPGSRGLNLNTVLLTVVLGLSGWTLTRITSLGEQMSAVNERYSGLSRDLLEIRARLASAEAQGQANALAIARMQTR